MGKHFVRSVALPNTDVVASASITPFDLPVNPLSLLLLRFQITNTDPTTVAIYSPIDDVVTQITGVRVLYKNEQIMSGSLRDLMIYNAVRNKLFPTVTTAVRTNDVVRSIVFPLALGRGAYNPMSCFPATKRGDLVFQMDAGADGAGYDDINMSLETVELVEAEPTEYVKVTTSQMTSVIGQFDARLPIGNPLLGILLFDTGLNTPGTELTSWGSLRLLKDNIEQYYSTHENVVLAGEMASQMGSAFDLNMGHLHDLDDGGAIESSGEAERPASSAAQGYSYLDFDPTRDLTYEMETRGAGDLLIRAVGLAASAVRYLPVERVEIKK